MEESHYPRWQGWRLALRWCGAREPTAAPTAGQPGPGDRIARQWGSFRHRVGTEGCFGGFAGSWANVPDLEGSGPFPASYALAPDGLEYVIYQPKDLAGAEAKGKLGVYVWGSGGCSADAASSRFHLTEIASHGYVVIVPGKILSGPKAPPRPEGMPSPPAVCRLGEVAPRQRK